MTPPIPAPDPLPAFVRLSAALTGFSAAELQSSGMVKPYWDFMAGIAGEHGMGRLLDADPASDAALQALLSDPHGGPLARNLITLWYLGQWVQLPYAWRNRHGAHAQDETHYLSAESYAAGLVWQAMHSHPQGARQPGFGSWSLAPVTETRDGH